MDETTFEMGHTPIEPVSFSLDGRFLFAVNGKNLQAWELLWEYTFPPPQDWEETARPYLEIFLTLTPASRPRMGLAAKESPSGARRIFNFS